jgi:hypothetical protein
VNFFILRVFQYIFAPRYRDLHKKMDGLVGFYHPSHYGNALIKPSRKVFDKLIIKEWPINQRILASLAQKEVTQATCAQADQLYSAKPDEKSAMGVGKYLSIHTYPDFHR